MTGFQILDLCIGIVLGLVMVGLFVLGIMSTTAAPAVVCVATALGMGVLGGYFIYNALRK